MGGAAGSEERRQSCHSDEERPRCTRTERERERESDRTRCVILMDSHAQKPGGWAEILNAEGCMQVGLEGSNPCQIRRGNQEAVDIDANNGRVDAVVEDVNAGVSRTLY
eukprot:scaffold15016_cov19-Prasinocladus_malaysianus.AAC.2